MAKHQHSVNYSAIHLQITAAVLMILFYFAPAALLGYLHLVVLFPEGLVAFTKANSWWLAVLYLFGMFYAALVAHVFLVGLVYRLVPKPVTGERVPTFSKDWLLWGIKAEIWKMTTDVSFIFSIVLKMFTLRWLFFSLIGLKIHRTSMIATDVRIYDPHLLEVGENCLLPVYSIFSGHLITGNTMHMEKIKIGNNVSIGARSGFGPGVVIGDGCTLGFGVSFGMNVQIGEACVIDSLCGFADDAVISPHVFMGKGCIIGRKAYIAPGIKVPDYTRLPAKARIESKKDLLKYIK